MNFNIVPMEEKHIEGFWKILDSVAKERKYLTFLEGPPIDTTRIFTSNMLKENWPVFIALDNDEIVGWCDIHSLNRPVYSHCGQLGMGVLRAHRRRGIGRALIQAALKKAKQKGLTRIELTVYENNKPAISLYKKLGFVEEGKHINAGCIDGKYENFISMALLYQ